MENTLINDRDTFSAHHPETRFRIHNREWGVLQYGEDGPALVLLPGTLGRGDIFWNQIKSLGDKARILALTYPDSGTISEWCDDIKALMDQHSFSSAAILGTSLGGYVAQYFAAVNPDRTDALIAANTLASVEMVGQIPPYNADLDALAADDLMAGFETGLRQWVQDEPHRADLVALLIAEVCGRIPVEELRARLKALKFAPKLPRQQIDPARIFTISSGDDRLIPPPLRAALDAHLTPVKSKHFETGSHFPYLTHADAYSAFLAEILGV